MGVRVHYAKNGLSTPPQTKKYPRRAPTQKMHFQASQRMFCPKPCREQILSPTPPEIKNLSARNTSRSWLVIKKYSCHPSGNQKNPARNSIN